MVSRQEPARSILSAYMLLHTGVAYTVSCLYHCFCRFRSRPSGTYYGGVSSIAVCHASCTHWSERCFGRCERNTLSCSVTSNYHGSSFSVFHLTVIRSSDFSWLDQSGPSAMESNLWIRLILLEPFFHFHDVFCFLKGRS